MMKETTGIKAEIKYAKLIKWENDENGNPMKDREPLEIMEKFGEDKPFVTTFRRNANASD